MYRTKKLVVRLNKEEAEAVNRLANRERLPASTLARRLLLLEAEELRQVCKTDRTTGAGVRP